MHEQDYREGGSPSGIRRSPDNVEDPDSEGDLLDWLLGLPGAGQGGAGCPMREIVNNVL